jgi:signal peptidase II
MADHSSNRPNLPNRLIIVLGVIVYVFDQFAKWLVLQTLPLVGDEKILVPGFFKFVHWGNTGAAWSLFSGNNAGLAIIGMVALVLLIFTRHHFHAHTVAGQIAFGLLIGGIAGNLTDRVLPGRHAVVDFIYFYLQPRGGSELGFPAFNIADSAICTGVALIFLISWKQEQSPKPA